MKTLATMFLLAAVALAHVLVYKHFRPDDPVPVFDDKYNPCQAGETMQYNGLVPFKYSTGTIFLPAARCVPAVKK